MEYVLIFEKVMVSSVVTFIVCGITFLSICYWLIFFSCLEETFDTTFFKYYCPHNCDNLRPTTTLTWWFTLIRSILKRVFKTVFPHSLSVHFQCWTTHTNAIDRWSSCIPLILIRITFYLLASTLTSSSFTNLCYHIH